MAADRVAWSSWTGASAEGQALSLFFGEQVQRLVLIKSATWFIIGISVPAIKRGEKMAKEWVKIYSRVRPQFSNELGSMAKNYSMSKSAMIALCTKIGMTYLKAITDPEGLLSAEKMADVLQELEKRGVELSQPEEKIEINPKATVSNYAGLDE